MCTLLVPLFAPPDDCTVAAVRAPNGQEMMHCEVARAGGRQEGLPRLVALHTALTDEPQRLLAYCKAGACSADGCQNVYLYNSQEELFAQLAEVPGQPCWELSSGRIGLHFIFQGDFGGHLVTITNEQGEKLACTKPPSRRPELPGEHYELDVASGVDVGIVLCSLLAVNQLRAQ
mmetsp:Transcript_33067/g.99604  ORF Transcript_33067/g.99604 Transcript_33067/m.99604 type:complete len:175 (+) Transcript_33067:222-746(+)